MNTKNQNTKHLGLEMKTLLKRFKLSFAKIVVILSFFAIFLVICLSKITGQREWMLLIPLAMIGIAIGGPFLSAKKD